MDRGVTRWGTCGAYGDKRQVFIVVFLFFFFKQKTAYEI